jgi:hypothetical protein
VWITPAACGADGHRPGAHFLHAGGEVGLQAQQHERGTDQPVQAQLGLAHDVRLNRAERVVLGRDASLGQGIEKGRLADVGQADDAAFEAHGASLAFLAAWGAAELAEGANERF